MKILVSSPTKRCNLLDLETNNTFNGKLENNVLFVYDVIEDIILEKIFKIYGKPKYILSDSHSTYNSKLEVDIYCIDHWVDLEITKYLDQWILPAVEDTKFTSNFLINKKQINRFLLIKFCEIFNIECSYTWSGIGRTFDLSSIVDEKSTLNDKKIDKIWAQILSPIRSIETNWIFYDKSNLIDSTSSVSDYGSNVWTWNNGLKDVVSQSAVSLISECIWTQTASTFSEKTAYAILGLTFPLWIGGVNQAADWQKKGFDTFDDIMDHSYQNMPTLLERCFYAFELNKKILTDLEFAKNIRQANIDRLLENRKKLLGDTIKKYNESVVATWPEEIKNIALPTMRNFTK